MTDLNREEQAFAAVVAETIEKKMETGMAALRDGMAAIRDELEKDNHKFKEDGQKLKDEIAAMLADLKAGGDTAKKDVESFLANLERDVLRRLPTGEMVEVIRGLGNQVLELQKLLPATIEKFSKTMLGLQKLLSATVERPITVTMPLRKKTIKRAHHDKKTGTVVIEEEEA